MGVKAVTPGRAPPHSGQRHRAGQAVGAGTLGQHRPCHGSPCPHLHTQPLLFPPFNSQRADASIKNAFALWAITSQFHLTSVVGEPRRAEGVIYLSEGNSSLSRSGRGAGWGRGGES